MVMTPYLTLQNESACALMVMSLLAHILPGAVSVT